MKSSYTLSGFTVVFSSSLSDGGPLRFMTLLKMPSWAKLSKKQSGDFFIKSFMIWRAVWWLSSSSWKIQSKQVFSHWSCSL